MTLPLKGIKVIELAQSLGSPYCTSLLGDFGANVINVEPLWGARTRKMGTAFKNGECSFFFSLNRSKRGILCDISKDEGKEIVRRLVKDADVVTENFRPGVCDRLGIGYDALSKINPRIVYLSITGFGSKGPLKDRPGIEMVFQGMTGLMNVLARDERGMPQHIGLSVSDMAAGVYAFMGIMLALYERELSGLGQKVEISNISSVLSMFSPHYQAAIFGHDSAASLVVPFRSFASKDGYLAIGIPSDEYWPNFCKALGIEDLMNNPLFKTNIDRVKNREAAESLIQSLLEQKTTKEWLEIFNKADAIGGPAYIMTEALEDPQFLANDMVVSVDHPITGKTKMIGIPMKLSRTPGKVGSPSPTMGQRTDEVLKEMGYSANEIGELKTKKVVKGTEA